MDFYQLVNVNPFQDSLAEWGLVRAVEVTFAAGVLAGIAGLIDLVGRRWMTAGQRALLWNFVLLRLAMPSAPPSVLSVHNLWATTQDAVTSSEAPNGIPDAYTGAPLAIAASDVPVSALVETSPAVPKPALVHWTYLWNDFPTSILPAVWFLGLVAIPLWTVILHWRLCRPVRRTGEDVEGRLKELWRTCCSDAGIWRAVPIKSVDGLRQPAVMGALRPQLLVPSDFGALRNDQIELVLRHELAHIRRWDVAANWLLVLVKAVQWWNPLCWLAARRYLALREQACDAFVFRDAPHGSTKLYGEVLLHFAEREPVRRGWSMSTPATLVGFVRSSMRTWGLRNRLKALASAALPVRRSRRMAAMLILAMVAVCGLTQARGQKKPENYDWLPKPTGARTWVVTTEQPVGPTITRAYAVHALLEQFRASFDDRDGAETAMCQLVEFIVNPEKREGRKSSTNTAFELVRLEKEQLLVRAPQSVHQELADTLSAWTKSGIDQICIECRIITSDKDLATDSGIGWRYFDGTGLGDELIQDNPGGETAVVSATTGVQNAVPVCSTTLNDEQAFRIVKTAQQDRRTNIMFAPKVTVFNARSALLHSGLQRPFVVGLQPSETGERKPEVKVVDEGLRLKLRPTRYADGVAIRLTGWFEISEVLDVVAVSTMTADGPVSLQIPRVNRCRINLASDVPMGETLLVGCVPSYEQKQFLYVMLTPKIVTPQIAGRPPFPLDTAHTAATSSTATSSGVGHQSQEKEW